MSSTDNTRQPGQPNPAGQPADFEPVAEAKALLRRIRAGALATIDAEDGSPFASLVNVATDVDGSPLLLLSRLAVHRANIEKDARISLLLTEGGKGDPLAHARLTVMGRAEIAAGEAVKARFLARHPKSALYAGFPDFGFFKIVVTGGHLNGGFARAARLSPEDLLTDCSGAEALREAEAGAIEHMNADHADAVRLYATKLAGARDGPWRLTGIDPEGIDMAFADETARVLFAEPVTDGGALRKTLVAMAAGARA
ncbi:HugZ family protein [Labrys okinawensis]|uniref:HugZ family pyridoxamine 5'-phosphate oxidase n=1 Tax=Labrys okinawensis TaxID=346911 RepID=UPI0039BCF042